ncbi:MAG: hypothetical protein HYU84_12505 [Chloroflexi bacterium]|nr:hypothetical protein [Chloroflexota bacterium]
MNVKMNVNRIYPERTTAGTRFYPIFGLIVIAVGILPGVWGGSSLAWGITALFVLVGVGLVWNGVKRYQAGKALTRGTSTARAVLVKRKVAQTEGQSVSVEYANENPAVFLIEGE